MARSRTRPPGGLSGSFSGWPTGRNGALAICSVLFSTAILLSLISSSSKPVTTQRIPPEVPLATTDFEVSHETDSMLPQHTGGLQAQPDVKFLLRSEGDKDIVSSEKGTDATEGREKDFEGEGQEGNLVIEQKSAAVPGQEDETSVNTAGERDGGTIEKDIAEKENSTGVGISAEDDDQGSAEETDENENAGKGEKGDGGGSGLKQKEEGETIMQDRMGSRKNDDEKESASELGDGSTKEGDGDDGEAEGEGDEAPSGSKGDGAEREALEGAAGATKGASARRRGKGVRADEVEDEVAPEGGEEGEEEGEEGGERRGNGRGEGGREGEGQGEGGGEGRGGEGGGEESEDLATDRKRGGLEAHSEKASQGRSSGEQEELQPEGEARPAVSEGTKGRPRSRGSRPSLGPACNVYRGRWVSDQSRPLYQGKICKWISPNWACRLSKRPKFTYEKYRWQPHDCDIPRFDRTDFLERMRNKALAFVGDSLGQQQFQSMLCLLSDGPDDPRVADVGTEYGFHYPPGGVAKRPTGWAYRFAETNTTVLMGWTSTLCELEPYNPSDHSKGYAMHLDRPDAFVRDYLGSIDVAVLNTGHHWNRGKVQANKWEFHLNGTNAMKVRRKWMLIWVANEIAVASVARWIDRRILEIDDPRRRPLVFLRALSPRHFMGGDWNSGGRCDNVEMDRDDSTFGDRPTRDAVAESAVGNTTSLRLLDIAYMSQFRGEAHPSIWDYRLSEGVQDCLHWCLPGVPDVWNELLYAQIILHGAGGGGGSRGTH